MCVCVCVMRCLGTQLLQAVSRTRGVVAPSISSVFFSHSLLIFNECKQEIMLPFGYAYVAIFVIHLTNHFLLSFSSMLLVGLVNICMCANCETAAQVCG